MMTITTLAGLGGCGLLLLALLVALLRPQRFSVPVRAAIVVMFVLLTLFQIEELPLLGYVRALTGDFSITSVFLLGAFCFTRLSGRPELLRADRVSILLGTVLITAVFLYPMALGYTRVDPYALGYGSNVFFAVLLGLTLVAWHFDQYVFVFAVTLAVCAHLLRLYESTNLWDYLLDPMLAVFAIFWLAWRGLRRLFCKKAAAVPEAQAATDAVLAATER